MWDKAIEEVLIKLRVMEDGNNIRIVFHFLRLKYEVPSSSG